MRWVGQLRYFDVTGGQFDIKPLFLVAQSKIYTYYRYRKEKEMYNYNKHILCCLTQPILAMLLVLRVFFPDWFNALNTFPDPSPTPSEFFTNAADSMFLVKISLILITPFLTRVRHSQI